MGGKAVAVVVVLAALAAACGGSDKKASGGDTAAAAVDPSGVLKLPFDLAGAQAKFDPIGVTSPFYWHYAIYDTLLRMHDDGTYEPGLAKSATIVDPSTITVELNPNLKFQDGTSLDAEAVKFGINRNITANKPGIFRVAELSQVDAINVDSPTKLTIKLKTPIAGSFYSLLAHGETMPVSPTAVQKGVDLNTAPVGAGPFKIEKFDAPNSVKLVKWDGYFEASKIRLAGIEFVNVPLTGGTAAVVNALRSHAIDGSGGTAVTLDTINELGGSVKTATRKSQDGTVFISLQCSTVAAFKDVRVRQALNYATDKDALNNVLLGGKGEAMSQFWSSEAKYYDPALKDVYKYDVNKAKSLLAAAGVPNLEFKMAVSPGLNQKLAEAVQNQWASAGIKTTLQVVQDTVTEYYLGKRQDAFPTFQNRIWTDKITRNFAPGSVGNTCDPQSADFTAKLNKLRGADPNGTDAVAAWKDVSKFLSDNAQGVFGVINILGYAWDDGRLADVTWAPDQVGSRYLDWHKVYVKKK
jgi:ABC-type transport system substrate-binding protein